MSETPRYRAHPPDGGEPEPVANSAAGHPVPPGRRASGELASPGAEATPRRSAATAASAASAVSASSPDSPGERQGGDAEGAERSPFAPPLPGEDDTPTVTMSRREVQAVTAATPGSAAAGGFGQPSPPSGEAEQPPDRAARSSRRPASRSAGRRAAPATAATFDLARARTFLIGTVVVLVALFGIGGVAYLMSRPGTPITVPGPQKSLALPDKAGDYTREQAVVPTPSQHSDGRTTITATYERGGKGQFVVLASRPEKDPTSALAALQAVGVQTAPGGACGRIGQQTACAVMASGSTALVGVTQVDQSKDELIVALRRVADAMG